MNMTGMEQEIQYPLIFSYFMTAAAAAKLLQPCPTLCDPMDCSLPGSSIHGIFQARVLEWGAIAFSIFHDTSPQSSKITAKLGYVLEAIKCG